MLRAYALALAAADARGRLAVALSGNDTVVIERSIPVVERFVRIECGEQVGNADSLRTLVLFDAVPARGARDQVLRFENVADLVDRR